MATAEHSASYKSRRIERGEVRVSVWIPASRVDELRQIADSMCAQADLAAGRPSKTPPVQVPRFETPELPPPGWSYLRVERDEIWLHMMLRANGATWRNEKQTPEPNTWQIRSDLVPKLGLEARVVRVVTEGDLIGS